MISNQAPYPRLSDYMVHNKEIKPEVLRLNCVEELIGSIQNIKHLTLHYLFVKSPMGNLLGATSDQGLCWLGFAKNEQIGLQDLIKALPGAVLMPDGGKQIEDAVQWFFGDKSVSTPTLHLIGTEFQINVWKALLQIPKGAVCSYAAVAEWSGYKKSVRAVATAIGHNKIVLLVPCHRVVRSDGTLGKYHYGEDLKWKVLSHEL